MGNSINNSKLLYSSKDTNEEHVVHPKSDSIEVIICDKADKVIQDLYESFYSRYQIELKTSVKGSDFIFDCVNLFHYK